MDIAELLRKWKIADQQIIEAIEDMVRKSAVILNDNDMSLETDSKNIAKLFDLNGIDFGDYVNFWETQLYEEGEYTASSTEESDEFLIVREQDIDEMEDFFSQVVQPLNNIFNQEFECSSSIKERLINRDKLSISISFPRGKSYTIESRSLTFELLLVLSRFILDDSIPPFLSEDVYRKAKEGLPQNETSFGLIHKKFLMNLIGIIIMSSAIREIKYQEDKVKAISNIVKTIYFKEVPAYYTGKLLSQRSVERLLSQMQ